MGASAALLLLVSFDVIASSSRTEVSALTPHAPISIVGNAQFTPANGVTGGSGTESDPYVIEGWSIDSTGPADVSILNTDAHFVLRNVCLYGHVVPHTEGIQLDNVSNGRVEHVSFSGTHDAVYARAVSRLTLSDLNATDGYGAVILYRSINVSILNSGLPLRGVEIEGDRLEHYNSHRISMSWTEYGGVEYVHDCNDLNVTANPTATYAELLIVNCTNVRLSKIVTFGGYDGVLLAFSSGVLVSDSKVQSDVDGIRIFRSSDVTLQRVRATFSEWGTLVESSRNVTILDSRFQDRSAGAIGVAGSTDVTVTNNTLVDNGGGIILGCIRNMRVSGNLISSNPYGGILGLPSSCGSPMNLTISGNTIQDSSPGVQLAGDGFRVFHNLLLRNRPQAVDGAGVDHAWDDGYPDGGNVWSDYTGTDRCSGVSQDTCPGPDGIGDTPRVIDEDSADRYPLIGWRAPTITSAVLEGPSFRDLSLTWRASTDEGIPGGTVRYEVMRATNPEGRFVAIATVAAAGSTFYGYSCVSCGHSVPDTTTFLFRVRAVDASNRTAESNMAARLSRPLSPGANLLGIPVLQADWSVPRVLQTLVFDVVRTYRKSDPGDPWKVWYASRPGELSAFRLGEGFWVNVTAPGEFTIAGLVDPAPAIPLTPGWNLVSYDAFAAKTRAESLAGVPGVGAVEAFDWTSADPYGLRAVPGSEVLVPGSAYWIWIRSGPGGVWVQS